MSFIQWSVRPYFKFARLLKLLQTDMLVKLSIFEFDILSDSQATNS